MQISNFKLGIIVIVTSLLIGELLSLIIGWTAESFVLISPQIVILHSLLLAATVLFSMYITRTFVEKINSITILILLSFGLMIGIGIISFLGFLVSNPAAFVYSNNLTLPFLLVNLLFFMSFNTISNGFVLFQYTMIKKEKALAQEILEKTQMEAELQANKRIMDSIQYAKRIQSSLLPRSSEIKKHLPDSFFIWQPRDVVGGDVYFTSFFDGGYILAVIDCTGHGVPGAFMTMLASSGLNRIINRENIHDPAEILKRLNYFVKMSLRQDSDDALSDDGLDISICRINQDEKRLTFAGSRLPLTYVYRNEVHSIKGDRHSIGYKKSDLNFDFQNHEIDIKEGMFFYLYTDGIIDQLGGEKRHRFGKRRLGHILKEVDGRPCENKRNRIIQAFEEYKGKIETLDDITFVGFNVSG